MQQCKMDENVKDEEEEKREPGRGAGGMGFKKGGQEGQARNGHHVNRLGRESMRCALNSMGKAWDWYGQEHHQNFGDA